MFKHIAKTTAFRALCEKYGVTGEVGLYDKSNDCIQRKQITACEAIQIMSKPRWNPKLKKSRKA